VPPPPVPELLPMTDEYETCQLGPIATTHARQVAAALTSPFQEEPNAAVWARMLERMDFTPKSRGPAGALWHLMRREDAKATGMFCMGRAVARAAAPPDARKKHLLYEPADTLGPPEDIPSPAHAIHSQAFYLTKAELAKMDAQLGVQPWAFAQHDREAVFIPAGCPHQVRNLRSCLKVALDFVSPEAAEECLVLSAEFASMKNEEKLQARLMMLHAAQAAAHVLHPPPAAAPARADGAGTVAEHAAEHAAAEHAAAQHAAAEHAAAEPAAAEPTAAPMDS
jgi:hypothetical protein